MKRCSTCHQLRPLDDFAVRRASPDGRQARCRQCFQDWYAENRERAQHAVARRIARVKAENRARLVAYLEDHPCVDCGESDLRVLEFDHRAGEDKRADVARLVGVSLPWRVVEQEIAKCDVRCANCHRRRTSERGGWWRERYADDAALRAGSQRRLAALFPAAG